MGRGLYQKKNKRGCDYDMSNEIRNKEALGYELGVLMFNIVLDHECSLVFNNNYDGLANFVGIFDSIGCIDIDDLWEGFYAECLNYSIDEVEARELFQEAVKACELYD